MGFQLEKPIKRSGKKAQKRVRIVITLIKLLFPFGIIKISLKSHQRAINIRFFLKMALIISRNYSNYIHKNHKSCYQNGLTDLISLKSFKLYKR